MNILHTLSLLPICLGAALPLNFSDQSSTQSNNLPVYETNIQYQYETNDVNSFSDIKVGNIYKINITMTDQEPIWVYTNINNFDCENVIRFDNIITGYISIYGYVDDITNEEYSSFHYSTSEPNLVYISFVSNMYGPTNINQQIDLYYILDFDNNTSDLFDFLNPIVLYCIMDETLYNNLQNDDYLTNFISRCPTEYIPYILVEPQVSDNLYVNLYNFYYDLFKNDEINSITFDIGSQNITLSSWIAHSLTIISLILFVVITILFVIWLFKFLSGFILLRQS